MNKFFNCTSIRFGTRNIDSSYQNLCWEWKNGIRTYLIFTVSSDCHSVLFVFSTLSVAPIFSYWGYTYLNRSMLRTLFSSSSRIISANIWYTSKDFIGLQSKLKTVRVCVCMFAQLWRNISASATMRHTHVDNRVLWRSWITNIGLWTQITHLSISIMVGFEQVMTMRDEMPLWR